MDQTSLLILNLTNSIEIIEVLPQRLYGGSGLLTTTDGDRRSRRVLYQLNGRVLSWTAGVCLLCTIAHAQVTVRDQGFVPFRDAPINYLSDRVNDPVAKLQQRIDQGNVTLEFDPKHGYLKSVLQCLQVPVSSQTLVFSKTSFQYKKISPSSPRALYFNDNVYVGWVQNGHSLEIASFDSNQGAIFYLPDQQPDQPAFVRATLDCTQCHVAPGTRGVPGVLLRSIFARPSGTQAIETDSFITGHETPLKDRFGGWYVTGKHGRQLHMGNVFVDDTVHPDQLDRAAGAEHQGPVASVPDNGISKRPQRHRGASRAGSPNADAQSDHRGQLLDSTGPPRRSGCQQNRRTSRSVNSRINPPRDRSPGGRTLELSAVHRRGALADPIEGTSGFSQEFTALGPRDKSGRSLREFDLKRRIFKYPCSYLIYSEAFDALPEPAKKYIYSRLYEILTGRDHSDRYNRLSPGERRDILEILLATKPGLPSEWQRLGTVPGTK